MKLSRKSFTREFKLAVLRELEVGKNVAEICREHGIKQDVVYRWKHEYKTDPVHAFTGKGNPSTLEARNAELERLVGKLYAENEFLKKASDALRAALAEAKTER